MTSRTRTRPLVAVTHGPHPRNAATGQLGPLDAVSVFVPIETPSVANLRLHWAAKARLVHRQRAAVALLWPQDARGRRLVGGGTVTLTRQSAKGRLLDDDNLASAMKAVRDAVADQLDVDDGDLRVTWCYEQRRGQTGVEIRLTPTDADLKRVTPT